MSVTSDVAGRIDTIESGYEYLLAYAAQGRQDESGSEVREKLLLMRAALDGLGELLAAAVGAASREGASAAEPFLQAVHADAAIARGAISLVLGRAALGSLLIDNLNASVHLRALLTDLFLIEQALKAPPAPPLS
jgi:hypothetical protein